ncbi:MAG: HAD-IG family 5'-nucleotidase [Polyangiales bacterium]
MTEAPRHADPGPARGVFCNRTLNMRSIRAVGCDMDYTLIHYDVQAWERRAYEHVQARLVGLGAPIGGERFDPELFTRGLILDVELGNVVKANRFGYVTRAAHGTALLSHEAQRKTYAQVWVDLSEPRWVFLNTLFSLSEVCLYAQLVDRMDREPGAVDASLGYAGLYRMVRDTMNAAHLEGELKAEVAADPERFVTLDPELPAALLDLKHAGKQLLLVTNSEWSYTRAMMSYGFDRFLPAGMGWRELFDVVIVQAGKPSFFEDRAPLYEIVDDSGLLRPCAGRLRSGQAYLGGHARLVEQDLGLAGEEILYVGDHVYADIHVSSQIRRWRTALVLRELEQEVAAEHAFAPKQAELEGLMERKQRLEREQAQLRASLQRKQLGYAAPLVADLRGAQERLRDLRAELDALDPRITALAKEAGQLGNARWGALMHAGNDKSRLARQIERYADVYTSRVSNFMYVTPFGYLRAPRGTLPHDSVAGSQS